MKQQEPSWWVSVVAAFVFGSPVGLVFYFLWWLHNDYPFASAIVAGIVFGVYHIFMVGALNKIGLRVRSIEEGLTLSAQLFKEHDKELSKITKRIEEDEQRLDDMEAPDDGPYNSGL